MQLQLQLVLTALLTALITGGLNYLAAWGLLPGLDIGTVSSGLASVIATTLAMSIAGAVAAWQTRTNAVLRAAGQVPGVEKIVAPDIADKTPVDKVVKQ